MSKKEPRKRIKIKGHYYQVRQRSTKKGKKGTIIGKWKPKKNGKSMEEERCESIVTKCHGCEKNEFCLTRITEHQVLAECIHCGHPHTLDSILKKKKRSTLLYWSTKPEASERCVECRAPLRIFDINVQTGRARAQCEKCGLLYIYKKDRLRRWRIVRVTKRVCMHV